MPTSPFFSEDTAFGATTSFTGATTGFLLRSFCKSSRIGDNFFHNSDEVISIVTPVTNSDEFELNLSDIFAEDVLDEVGVATFSNSSRVLIADSRISSKVPFTIFPYSDTFLSTLSSEISIESPNVYSPVLSGISINC